jgi:hypothetical protein
MRLVYFDIRFSISNLNAFCTILSLIYKEFAVNRPDLRARREGRKYRLNVKRHGFSDLEGFIILILSARKGAA